MEHIIFLLYFVSFIVGCVSVGLFISVYYGYKTRLSKYYLLFLLSMTFLFLSHTLLFYMSVNIPNIYYSLSITILGISFSISVTFFIYFMPLFVYCVSGVTFTKKDWFLYTSISMFIIVLHIKYFFYGMSLILSVAINVMFFLVVLYNLIILARSLKKEKDKKIIRIKKVFLTLSIIFFPLLPLDSVKAKIEIISDYFPYGFFFFPVFFMLWNIFGMYFALKYIPGIKNNSDVEINNTFIQKYAITKREYEILPFILNGYNYSEIAETLRISIPTVKTHISNIYKKTGIKNKIELVNFIEECNLTLIQT